MLEAPFFAAPERIDLAALGAVPQLVLGQVYVREGSTLLESFISNADQPIGQPDFRQTMTA